MRNATDQASALTTAIIMIIVITMIISIIIMSCDTQNIIEDRQVLCLRNFGLNSCICPHIS